MSAGLRSSALAPALRAMRRLCRYDPPGGSVDVPPVSFGWLDVDSHRIAFHRTAVESDHSRGNFAAHLLLAPRQVLPEAMIARSFASGFWWTGLSGEELAAMEAGKSEFELPLVETSDMLAGLGKPAEVDEASLRLAHELLNLPPKARLGVEPEGRALALAIRDIGWLLPDVLAGLSLSTYEREAVFPFQVVGASAPGEASRACDLSAEAPPIEDSSRRALTALLAGAPEGVEPLGEIATRISRGRGDDVRGGLWQVARQMVALSGGELGAEQAAELLCDPGAVGFACRSREGRATVAAVLQHSGSSAALAAVANASGEMEAASLEDLRGLVARGYRATPKLWGCSRVLAALGQGAAGGEIVDAVLDVALQDEGAARELDGDDVAMVLRRAAERGVDVGAARMLLRSASRHIARCARAREISERYLAAMFGFELSDPTADVRLTEAVRLRPALLAEVQLDGSENDRCLEVLGPLAESMIPPKAADCILRTPLGTGSSAPPPALGRVCDDLAARLLKAEAIGLALRLLERSGSKDSRRALRLLDGGNRDARVAAAAATHSAAEVQNPALCEALSDFFLGRAVHAVEGPADTAAVWEAVEQISPEQGEEEVLRRMLSGAKARPRAVAAAEILAWIALVKAPESPKLINRFGKIREEKADELALDLAGIAGPCLALAGESVGAADRSSQKFWKRLEKRQAKKR
jgi:hypothetical protein